MPETDSKINISKNILPSEFNITWQAPSNIALIKYWGKHGDQLPNNPSLSISLKKALTTTKLRAVKAEEGTNLLKQIKLKYTFEGQHVTAFENRIEKYLSKLLSELPFLSKYHIYAESNNTFPHSAGIASSASSMAALALCLTSFEAYETGKIFSNSDFFQRASHLARLGSGSASRSVYGNLALWGKTGLVEKSSNEFAVPLQNPVHKLFQNPGVAILVVSSAQKKLSSTKGHQLMENHPFAEARYKQADNNLKELLSALETGDFNKFADITENEALTLHGLLMTSTQEGLLIKPESLKIIEAVRHFRKTTGTKVCFTMDAGPNVLLIYPQKERGKVVSFIAEQLAGYCENQKWIDDNIGPGPTLMKEN